MNVVSLTGRLTSDIELKYTPAGNAYGRFTLAVTRRMKNANGEYESDFIRCTSWGKTAEILADFTSKGTLIGVQGRIQTGSYDNQQGQKVYTTDVVVEAFDFLESSKNKNGNTSKPQKQQDDYENFDISDDDLPF